MRRYRVSITGFSFTFRTDKAKSEDKDTAHHKFQEIAFAYAVLSDERRRKRYDATGRTEDTLDLDDDDFNWADFYREQWKDTVTTAALEEFKKQYKEGEEEKADLLASYTTNEGNMDVVFESVMLSNPLEDEDRFRAIINSAVKNGEVEAFDAFTKESKKSRKRRAGHAKKEAVEAQEMARELGVESQLFGAEDKKSAKKGKSESTSESALAALIQQRQQSRSEGFLDRLEQKYASSSKPNKRKKVIDEPPEELFAKNAKKQK